MPDSERDADGPRRGAMNEPPPIAPLDTHIVGSRILLYDEADSTNECALRIGGHGTVLVANSQTAGRGRHGRPWHSAPGLGLWFSVSFEKRIPGLIFAAPLAARDALRLYAEPQAKWPNDLYLSGKKVCGILLEHRDERTVLGIGINVHQRPEDFPPDLRDSATSIELATGTPCDRGRLLREVLTHLDNRVMVLESGDVEPFRRQWVQACGILGKRIRSGKVEGIVVDVDDYGALSVETGEGPSRIVFGEVAEVGGT